MSRHARTVFPVMGTMVTIAVAESDWMRLGDEIVCNAINDVRAELHRIDDVFSHYRLDSAITMWARGADIAAAEQCEIELVLAECARLSSISGGSFAIIDPRTGSLDTAGYVKGYAIDNAVAIMRDAGLANFAISVGGDGYYAGRPVRDRPWRVAVHDPRKPAAIFAIVEAEDLAVATSGRAERGDHIWTGHHQSDLLSFTVVGPSIAEADAYATTGFAMAEAGAGWVAQQEGYRSIVARADGSVMSDAALVSAA